MKALIIVILIYIIFVILAYKFFQKAHYGEKARWANLVPGTEELLYTFLPFFNIFFGIMYIFGFWKSEKYRTKENFFKPKK